MTSLDAEQHRDAEASGLLRGESMNHPRLILLAAEGPKPEAESYTNRLLKAKNKVWEDREKDGKEVFHGDKVEARATIDFLIRQHLPVIRHVTPAEFAELKRLGYELGFQHVESGPLVRSSYHAADAVAS